MTPTPSSCTTALSTSAELGAGADRSSTPALVAGGRRIGVTTATLQVVASMVGTGVFTTTGLLLRDLGSPSAVLVTWLLGGLLALCGALSYSELVGRAPVNGGEYAILARVFHPAVGFVAGWISLIVGFSAPIAAASLAFGQYLRALLPGAHPETAAVLLVALLALLHAVHQRAGSSVQNLVTLLNVGLVLLIVGAGLWQGELDRIAAPSAATLGAAAASPAFAIALVYVSFSYSGWNGAAYLAGELREPRRTLPRALLVGTSLVTLLFIGLNVVFLASAPAAELSGVVEIGHVAAMRLFGARAGLFVSAVISLALLASVSAMTMAGPRVVEAMGRDYPKISWLGHRTRSGGPAAAAVLQAAVALVMVVTATFEVLLTYIGFTLSLVAGLTVVGLIVARRRDGAPRSYRAWGYPLTPILFVGLSGWMVVHALLERPVVALAGLGTIASGVVLYRIVGRRGAAADRSSHHPGATRDG